jgi:mono/diheme cytochrome c family protein
MTGVTSRQPHSRTVRAARVFALACACALAVVGVWAVTPQAAPLAAPQARAAAGAPDGAALYRTYCASCHGTTGRGDGPVAAVLRVPPADLTMLAQRNGGTYPADRIAERIDGRANVAAHGPSEMPVWGDALSSQSLAGQGENALRTRVGALVEHLRTLQARAAE